VFEHGATRIGHGVSSGDCDRLLPTSDQHSTAPIFQSRCHR
jgi:hypothetical protein